MTHIAFEIILYINVRVMPLYRRALRLIKQPCVRVKILGIQPDYAIVWVMPLLRLRNLHIKTTLWTTYLESPIKFGIKFGFMLELTRFKSSFSVKLHSGLLPLLLRKFLYLVPYIRNWLISLFPDGEDKLTQTDLRVGGGFFHCKPETKEHQIKDWQNQQEHWQNGKSDRSSEDQSDLDRSSSADQAVHE